MAIDLGTSGTRCHIFDETLRLRAAAYETYPLRFPEAGHIEQRAQDWLDVSLRAARRALDALPDRGAVEALSISSQGIAFVPVDAAFEPIADAISWLDTRGEGMLDALRALVPEEEIVRRSGKPLLGAYTLPKLLWMKRHRPEIYARAAYFLLPMDYLIAQLTGRCVTDYTMAGGTMLFDVARLEWDEALAAACGIALAKLPQVLAAGTVAGTLRPRFAADLGLSENTRVVVGGQDQKCAALAAGLGADNMTLSLGTAAALEQLMSRPATEGAARIPVFPDLFGRGWIAEGAVNEAGVAFAWCTRLFGDGRSYADWDEALARDYPSAERLFFFPRLSEDGASPRGWPAPPAGVFWGLALRHGAEDMARAVMEAISFEAALLAETIEETFAAPRPERVRLFGGGAKSRPWAQLLADTLGMPLERMDSDECAALGAAILAGLGLGLFPSAEAAQKLIRPRDHFLPRPENVRLMRDKKRAYQALKQKLYEEVSP